MATYDAVATIDTDLSEPNPTTNYGGAFTLHAGDGGGKTTNTIRALLYFDLSALVGIGATVTTAPIDYNQTGKTDVGAGADHALHKLTNTRQTWVEAEATWNIWKTANNWTTAGGDYETTPTKHTWSVAAGTGIKTIASSAELVALVQDAIDNEAGALHAIWKEDDESDTTNQTQITLSSSEDATPGNRPTIHVTYTVATTRRRHGQII